MSRSCTPACATPWRGSTNCDYEHIFIDNASTDNTADLLKQIASQPIRASNSSSTRAISAISARRCTRCWKPRAKR